MSAPGEPARQDGSAEIDEILTVLSGSSALDLLGMTTEDLQSARTDSTLFETLQITHEFLLALRQKGVLGTFLLLPKGEQANFVRWIGATDEETVRHERTVTFISALEEGPLAGGAG